MLEWKILICNLFGWKSLRRFKVIISELDGLDVSKGVNEPRFPLLWAERHSSSNFCSITKNGGVSKNHKPINKPFYSYYSWGLFLFLLPYIVIVLYLIFLGHHFYTFFLLWTLYIAVLQVAELQMRLYHTEHHSWQQICNMKWAKSQVLRSLPENIHCQSMV